MVSGVHAECEAYRLRTYSHGNLFITPSRNQAVQMFYFQISSYSFDTPGCPFKEVCASTGVHTSSSKSCFVVNLPL